MPLLDFTDLAALARHSEHVAAACSCADADLSSWESVPLPMREAALEEVGTLLSDPYVEPTFAEFHPDGTRYESPRAPIAPRYFPYNRCAVARCLACGRCYLRYTEAGGYFVEQRIRALRSGLLVDAP